MSLLFFGLFIVSVFGAGLSESVVSVSRWDDVRIGLPHVYSSLFLALSSLFAYLTMTAPFSFLWCLTGGLSVLVALLRRWLPGVDDAHWLRYALQDQSQSLLVSLHTMNATKTDKVRALAHKQATAAEDSLKLLHHMEKTRKFTSKEKLE